MHDPVGRSPAAVFDDLTALDPGRRAICVLQGSWTREEVDGFARRTATRLHLLGVGRGDRVAIVRRNAALHLIASIAVARLGAVLVPVNFRLPAAECATILRDAGASVVICGPRHALEFEAAIDAFAPATWVVDDMDPTTDAVSPDLPDRWHRFSELPGGEHDRPAPEPVAVGADDLYMLQYTSGSTGRPKGVEQTYGTVWASWRNFASAVPSTAFESTLTIAPFGHVGGLHSFSLQTLLHGGTVVVQRQFDVGHALELVERERVRSVFGVPAMYEAMSRHPDFPVTDISSLDVAMIGGASAHPDLLEIFRGRGVPMYHSWGMTETLGAGTVLQPADYPGRERSIGLPVPEVELRFVDGSLQDVPDGEIGELCIRGASVTPGYWGIPADPAHGFLPGGWLRTGDLAARDAQGFVTLRGRAKDMIISGGENIYPAEVERELATLPDVASCAVVGVPDARWGETPMAFVVPARGVRPPTLEGLRTRLSGRLARYKLPRHLQLLDEMPLGSTGKIDRLRLAAWGREGRAPGLPWYSGETPTPAAGPAGEARDPDRPSRIARTPDGYPIEHPTAGKETP